MDNLKIVIIVAAFTPFYYTHKLLKKIDAWLSSPTR